MTQSLEYAWDLDVAGDLQSKMKQRFGQEFVPCSGNAGVTLKEDRKQSYNNLADSFDEARQQLNSILTYWKDAVGPEQDSSFGRSNQAHMATPTDDDPENDLDEEEEEDQEENNDQVPSVAQTTI